MALRHDDSALRQTLSRYAAIPRDQWDLMLRDIVVVDAAKGAVLQSQDEPADWLGFLERGVVRMFRNLDGREVNLGFEIDGGFTGAYEAYMQRQPCQYFLQTLEASRLWRFDRPMLDALLSGHPCWRELSGRIAEESLARRIQDEMVTRTQTPEQRYAAMVRDGSPLVRRLPQYHLASFLGIAPETLSRIRARMG